MEDLSHYMSVQDQILIVVTELFSVELHSETIDYKGMEIFHIKMLLIKDETHSIVRKLLSKQNLFLYMEYFQFYIIAGTYFSSVSINELKCIFKSFILWNVDAVLLIISANYIKVSESHMLSEWVLKFGEKLRREMK